MTVIDRMKSPTPKFYKKIRNAGLVLAAASAAILASPVVLPAALVQTAIYLGVAGSVASAISQSVPGRKDVGKKKES